jgi:hypothetical protein
MPSSSAPCQPASQQANQPGEREPVAASQVQAPELQKICEAEGGQAQGTTHKAHYEAEAGGVERDF